MSSFFSLDKIIAKIKDRPDVTLPVHNLICHLKENFGIDEWIETFYSSEIEIPSELQGPIDSLCPIFDNLINQYSARVRNCMKQLFLDRKKSVANLYKLIASEKFIPIRVKNLGKSSLEEFNKCAFQIRVLVERVLENGRTEAKKMILEESLRCVGIDESIQNKINLLYDTLGYYPVFFAINAMIDFLPEESKQILIFCINIYENQRIDSRSTLKEKFDVSYERVRQKRNRTFDTLQCFFKTVRALQLVQHCPYQYEMNKVHMFVNQTEGTNFNLNFVNWTIASIYPDVSFAGNPVEVFCKHWDKGFFIVAYPTELSDFFDFQGYLDNLNLLLSESRQETQNVNLDELISAHLKRQYCDDYLSGINRSCRSIIYLYYELEVDYGKIIFKPNAYKHAPGVIESIIVDKGRPMPIEELVGEYLYLYAERDTDETRLRTNALRNKNICCLYRNPIYDLSDECYYGIKGVDYGDAFVNVTLRRGTNRPTEVSLKLIEQFIDKNGHYPFLNPDNPEETDLCRILTYQRKQFDKGDITETAEALLTEIDTKYSHLNYNGKDWQWMKECDAVKQFVLHNDFFYIVPNGKREITDLVHRLLVFLRMAEHPSYGWLYRNNAKFIAGQLSEIRQDWFRDLLDSIQKRCAEFTPII